MSICNICGANYEYIAGKWKCPACGAYKPEELSNEEQTLLYYADQKRRIAAFSEAEDLYADIIEKYPLNPQGYWGRMLARHGIKYERDYDGRMIPTISAPSAESIYDDKDCWKAIDIATGSTQEYFKEQAKIIERLRTIWAEKASKEKPYDIFICYKDSDLEKGIERTEDSIEAQDIYLHLTSQGYRVFYSRESLRDKVGDQYEPYIFTALSSAKLMLVYGTSAEYITSTWLKNEWSRYLGFIKKGIKNPTSLIVACDGFSPSELPTALASMQCLDASRKTFFGDLDAKIRRTIGGKTESNPVESISEPPRKAAGTFSASTTEPRVEASSTRPTFTETRKPPIKPVVPALSARERIILSKRKEIVENYQKCKSVEQIKASARAKHSDSLVVGILTIPMGGVGIIVLLVRAYLINREVNEAQVRFRQYRKDYQELNAILIKTRSLSESPFD